MTISEILDMLNGILYTTGEFNSQFKLIITWAVFLFTFSLQKYESRLLLPIGFGIFMVSFPLVPLMGISTSPPNSHVPQEA